MWQQLLEQIITGNRKALARGISYIENEQPRYEQLLQSLPFNSTSKIIGITGPPGAGKSTLVDGLISEMVRQEHKVAVICVDPSSPFHLGALLGDRIRMSQWYVHPDVFIRSLATRGSMGGLHPKIIEISDLVKAAQFEYIIIETVGVGQSEIEIVGLADTTVVVLVPEGGDEIQTMKSGLMEIADIFVVNKSDRPGADIFIKNLKQIITPDSSPGQGEVPVLKTVASDHTGLTELFSAIQLQEKRAGFRQKKSWLFTEKAWQLIQQNRMKNVDKNLLKKIVDEKLSDGKLNLYQLVNDFGFSNTAS